MLKSEPPSSSQCKLIDSVQIHLQPRHLHPLTNCPHSVILIHTLGLSALFPSNSLTAICVFLHVGSSCRFPHFLSAATMDSFFCQVRPLCISRKLRLKLLIFYGTNIFSPLLGLFVSSSVTSAKLLCPFWLLSNFSCQSQTVMDSLCSPPTPCTCPFPRSFSLKFIIVIGNNIGEFVTIVSLDILSSPSSLFSCWGIHNVYSSQADSVSQTHRLFHFSSIFFYCSSEKSFCFPVFKFAHSA